jgi:hypothetical protein
MDSEPFIAWLQKTIGINEVSAKAYSTAVGRLLRACEPMTVESLTELLYTYPTHKRNCARTAWKQWCAYNLEQGIALPVPGYVGKQAEVMGGNVPEHVVAGLRASHQRAREAKHARDNPAAGRIMISLTDGTVLVGDVEETDGRVNLVRATMMQPDGTLAILPGKVSFPAEREVYRVCVANDAYLGRGDHNVRAR